MITLNKVRLLLFFLLLAIICSCDSYEYKRDFSLSSVASFPSTISELKNRWFFCEKCLNSTQCNLNDVKQCKTVTLPDRNEALNLAVGRTNTEAVHFLVSTTKADVNSAIGEYKETPLIVAAYYGTEKHREISSFLISHGADINATAHSPTDTALVTALWKNNIEFSIFLLKNGANPTVTASGKKDGYVCRYAIEKKQAEIIPYIPDCCSTVKQDSHWLRETGYLCP